MSRPHVVRVFIVHISLYKEQLEGEPKLHHDLRLHLVLLGYRWQSPTYTIFERRTNMRAFTVCMRVPNTDDETGRENKWYRIDEELREA